MVIMNKQNTKKKFLIGITFIVVSFVGFMFIFYIMGNSNVQNSDKIQDLQDQVTVLEVEKTTAEVRADGMSKQVNAIRLKDLISEADSRYSTQEKMRTEGLLWIDSEKSVYVITLGAINGLEKGKRLGLYEKDKRIGEVIVDVPLDVISYVIPADESIKLGSSYYKVVIEE